MTKNSNKKILLMLFCILTLTAILLYNFNGTANSNLSSITAEGIERLAVQQQLSFDTELKKQQTDVEVIAKTISLLIDTPQNAVDYLNMVQEDFGYNNVIFLNTEGKHILDDSNYSGEVMNEKAFNAAIGGETFTCEPYVSSITDSMVVGVSTPLYKSDEIIGVMIAEYSTDYLTELLRNAVYESAWAIVVNDDTDVLITTNPDIPEKLPLDYAEYEDGYSHEQVLSDIRNKNVNLVYFNMLNQERVASYRPLYLNDWTIFYVMPKAMVTGVADSISRDLMMISTIIIVAFVGFIVFLVITERRNIKRIEQVAYYDPLTGLRNLAKFRIDAAEMMHKNKDKQYYLVKADVVNFKAVNELYDYGTGNCVIKTIAMVGREMPQESFIQARMGPDEFIMLGDETVFSDMTTTSYRYEKRFHELLNCAEDHQFSFRLGRYHIEDRQEDINDIISKVNIAHSMAKQDKTAHMYDYVEKYKEQILSMTDITNRMRSALENGEFKVFLQPKISLKGETVVGAEALVRWIPDDGNVVYPNDFIPIFEGNGFIVELDRYMLRCICEQQRNRLIETGEILPVSVNFSRLNIKNPDFVDSIKAIVDSYEIPPEYIEIELTETITQENSDQVDALFDELSAAGFVVAIDDFGSGYSSLGMLKNINVNILKLDRSFFLEHRYGRRGNLVVDGIVSLAHQLNMTVVAEGIEEKEQVDYLTQIGCDCVQGYYYAKPMPIAEFEERYFKEVTS